MQGLFSSFCPLRPMKRTRTARHGSRWPGFQVERGSRVKPEAARGAQGRSPEHRTGEDFRAKPGPWCPWNVQSLKSWGQTRKRSAPLAAPLTTEGDSLPSRRGGKGGGMGGGRGTRLLCRWNCCYF